jgi:hypothetical protein
LLIPVAVTGATLASVSRNRAASRAPMTLSERELSPRSTNEERTITAVYLSWHSRPWPDLRSDQWRTLPRRGYVAMELDGPALAALDLPPGARDERVSRLVVVDADLDAQVLEQRYPDGRRHLITAATLRPIPGQPIGRSLVVNVEPQRISVPRPWAQHLAGRPFRFSADVAYGARYEPWITRIGVR